MPRILIIDDDLDFLKVSRCLLQNKGFETAIAVDWGEACNAIESFKPHLILLDIFLADIDGLEICKKLKASSRTSQIPIIIISGYPTAGERAVYEFGAEAFICKPFELSELISHIHQILNRDFELA